jgi:hypothetical protein
MSGRTTQKDVERAVEKVAKLTKWPLVLEYAYGQPRVYISLEDGTGGLSNFSPRLSKRELVDWLDTFYEGFYAGWMDGRNKKKIQ